VSPEKAWRLERKVLRYMARKGPPERRAEARKLLHAHCHQKKALQVAKEEPAKGPSGEWNPTGNRKRRRAGGHFKWQRRRAHLRRLVLACGAIAGQQAARAQKG
jgi:hypothetical protein